MLTSRILIVENEQPLALALERELADLGYTVVAVVTTVAEALTRCAEACPDLVLLGAAPDGTAAAAQLRERCPGPVVPVMPAPAPGALAPHSCLLRPFTPRELQLTIELALHTHARPEPPPAVTAPRRVAGSSDRSKGEGANRPHAEPVTSEDERGEAPLQDQQATLNALLENTDSSIWSIDTAYRLIISNSAFRHTVHAAGGRPFEPGDYVLDATLASGAAEEWRRYYDRALRGESFSIEMPFRLLQLPHWMGYRLSPILETTGGRIVGATVLGRDITKQKQAEATLLKSAARLRQAQHLAQLGYWDWYMDTDTLSWSDTTYGIFGQDPRDFTPSVASFEAAIHPHDLARFLEERAKALAQDRDVDIEHRIIRPDGAVRCVHELAEIVRDEQGNVLRVMGAVQDITERRQAESVMRETLEKYRILFESFPSGITISDSTGRIVEVNPHSERLLGISVAEHTARRIDGEDWRIVRTDGSPMPPEEYPSVKALQEQRIVRDVEMGIVHPDGQIVWINATAAPLRDNRVVVTYNDVTDRKRAEALLQETVGRYRALVMALPDIITRFDREGRHLFMSENVEASVGIPAHAFIGRSHRDMGFDPVMCDLWETSVERVFETGAPYETEFKYEDERGTTVFNWRLVPEFDAQGTVQSVVSVSRDVTEQRRAEENYQTLFQEMLDGFALHKIILDDAGKPVDYRFLAANPAFEVQTGLRVADVLGRTMRDVLPDAEQLWIDRYGKVALTGEPAYFESYSQELSRTYEVKAFRPIPYHFACIFTDITEWKRADEELRKSDARHRQLARENANLVHEVNHRVGNNMALLLSLIDWAMEDVAEPIVLQVLQDLRGRINSMAGVHHLLNRTQWAPVDVRELVQPIVDGVLITAGRDHEIQCQVDYPPSPAYIAAKPAFKIALVLNELVTNSLKHAFSKHRVGRITVRITTEGPWMELAFADDGPGWSGDVLAGQKWNMGLSLIRAIIEQEMEGTMALSNAGGAVARLRFMPKPEGTFDFDALLAGEEEA